MVNSAHEVCHRILDQLKSSQLNFKITETPFSAEVIVRKRFIKNPEILHQSFVNPPPSDQISDDLESRNHFLQNENLSLSENLKVREDTIRRL